MSTSSNGKRILHLTLKKHWFDAILFEFKDHEYRQAKPHWNSRLLDKHGRTKQFDEVHFANGYGKEKPFMVIECLGISMLPKGSETPDYCETLDSDSEYFAIKLGLIKSTRNAFVHTTLSHLKRNMESWKDQVKESIAMARRADNKKQWMKTISIERKHLNRQRRLLRLHHNLSQGGLL